MSCRVRFKKDDWHRHAKYLASYCSRLTAKDVFKNTIYKPVMRLQVRNSATPSVHLNLKMENPDTFASYESHKVDIRNPTKWRANFSPQKVAVNEVG